MLIVYEGYQTDISGFDHSPSAIRTDEETSNSSDCPHNLDDGYDGDISNSSTDYNIPIEDEINQTTTLCTGYAEAASRAAKHIASFYPTRFVVFCHFFPIFLECS